MPDRQHCELHHYRRQQTWREGSRDFRARQKARTELLENWLRLVGGRLVPACNEAYDHIGLAMDHHERVLAAY